MAAPTVSPFVQGVAALQRPPPVRPPPGHEPKAPWRRPTLRKIDARDASSKGRAPHDMLHLS
jgi:hypothetical protein